MTSEVGQLDQRDASRNTRSNNKRPARCVRSSELSRRSSATTNAGATRSLPRRATPRSTPARRRFLRPSEKARAHTRRPAPPHRPIERKPPSDRQRQDQHQHRPIERKPPSDRQRQDQHQHHPLHSNHRRPPARPRQADVPPMDAHGRISTSLGSTDARHAPGGPRLDGDALVGAWTAPTRTRTQKCQPGTGTGVAHQPELSQKCRPGTGTTRPL